MGNFLVILPTEPCAEEGARLFQRGLAFARTFHSSGATTSVENDWVRAISWARQNGSGTPVVSDAVTRNWVLAAGTWFHRDGYASGEEPALLRRYSEAGGLQLASELEGFFTIVIGDDRNKEVIVLTDIIGSSHSFVRGSGGVTAISGSSLLLAALGDYTPDPIACQEFLLTGIVYEDRTLYKEVRKLGPAMVFRFKSGALRCSQRYWSAKDLSPESLDGPAAVAGLWNGTVEAARRVKTKFPDLVCDLTGGYDSRAIVAAFLEAGSHCATVVSGAEETRDVIISRGLAHKLGLPHLHMDTGGLASLEVMKASLTLTDGECDLAGYSRVMQIHQTLSQRFQISINGSFGEVARGYWWELLFPRAGVREKLNARELARRRYIANPPDLSIFLPEVRLNALEHFAGMIERTNEGLFDLPNTLQMDNAYLVMRMQRWQGRIASSTNRLWPCLSPFMFRSVLERMLQATVRLRRRGLLVRKMLAEFRPELASYPLEHGYPALPVTWRTAYRFWPLAAHYAKKSWEKGLTQLKVKPVRETISSANPVTQGTLWRENEVQETLYSPIMRSLGLFNRSALDRLAGHLGRNGRYKEQGSRLLTFALTLKVLERSKTLEA
jgi:asparagine synthase (glutamine-hydrolysing)